jgi:uncharacterized protein (TIGR02217 family)
MAELSGRYPDCIALGAEGGHGYWPVEIVEHAGGVETAVLISPDSRGRWNVSRVVEETGQYELARSHFYKARGRLHYFRFKDHHDFTCDRVASEANGYTEGRLVGSGTSWQLSKVYGTDDATNEYVRPLYRIVAGSESIWRNGALMVRNTDYTITNDGGDIVSSGEWGGDTLEMSCEFDCLCRYDTERMNARVLMQRSPGVYLIDWTGIDIVEVFPQEVEGSD